MAQPSTSKMFIDPQRPGIIRWNDDPTTGILAGMRAAEIVRAVNAHDELVEAVDTLLMLFGRTGDAFYDFEEIAEVYHKETGRLRPGKDTPAARGDDGVTQEQRRILFNTWARLKAQNAAVTLTKSKPTVSKGE